MFQEELKHFNILIKHTYLIFINWFYGTIYQFYSWFCGVLIYIITNYHLRNDNIFYV
jgi:hypothetical protein